MTDEPLDLEAIKARDPFVAGPGYVPLSVAERDALVAEVERLQRSFDDGEAEIQRLFRDSERLRLERDAAVGELRHRQDRLLEEEAENRRLREGLDSLALQALSSLRALGVPVERMPGVTAPILEALEKYQRDETSYS